MLLKKILPIFTIFVILLSPVIQEFAFGLGVSTTSVTSNDNPSLVGSPVTFTAHIGRDGMAAPTGYVVFVIDGNPDTLPHPVSLIPGVGHGSTFTTSTLSLGSHQIRAEYSGDDNYAGSVGGDPSNPTVPYLLQNVVSSTETSGHVNILATCGMQFASGSPINYGSLAPGTTSAEQTLVIHNTGSISSTLFVSGSNWLDSSPAATNQMNVDNTKFSSPLPGILYASKTSLSTVDQTVGTLSPTLDMNTFWQLQVNLLSSTFAGSLTQTMSFATTC